MPQLKNTTTENKENKESGTKRAKTTPPPPRRAGASVSALTAKSSSSSNDETSDLVVGKAKASPSATGDTSPRMEARDGAVGIAAGYHATEYSKEGAPEGEAFKPFRSNNGAGVDSSFVNHVSQDTNGDISGRGMIVSRTKVSRKYHLCYPRYENGKILIQGLPGYPLTFKKDEDWRKVEELGHGQYARCWSIIARDKWDMCVKEPRVVKTETLEECRKEVEIMLKIQHANVVTFYGATYEDQMIYIFMELIPGGTMKDLMDRYYYRHQEIDIGSILKWTIQIMRALVYLHRNGIAHYDLHVGNILLDAKREGIRICLADFGISSVRCDECKSCNEFSTYGQSCADCVDSNCLECGMWQEGRIDDVRESALLVHALVSVPREVVRVRVWEKTVEYIGSRDKKLSTFADGCMKLRPTQDLLEILTPLFPGTT